MKKLIINLFALTIAVYVTGCYTIIWDPVAEKFPTQQNSYDVYDGYYPENNFGDYSIYYDRPWWFDITPPAFVNNNYNRDADPNISIIRNLDRGSRTGINWLLFTNPPARGSQQQTVNVNKANNSTNTNPTSTGTTQTTRENSNSVRNNDGSRNTENRRKK